MLIDWFTVIAQIINFLVLIALLKHFLYDRIINAINQREEKIASRLEEAEKKREEAEREVEISRKKNQELEDRREQMLFQAKEEAEAQRKELIKKARHEVDRIQARWYEAIQREKDSFLQDLRQRAGQQVYAIARLALTDLAHADLEQRMIDVFVYRIMELDEEKRKEIAELIKKGDKRAVVTSAFEIPMNVQQRITKVVRSHLGGGIDLQYQISSDVILGIELKVHGYKIAWSLDNYLESLEANISEALEEKAKE